jgi:hypothetical protein
VQDRVVPALIKVGSVVAMIVGSMFLVGAIGAALGFADLAGLQDSPFGQWALPVWGTAALVIGAMLIASAFGLRRRRSWARGLAVAVWLVLGLVSITALLLDLRRPEPSGVDFSWVIGLAISLWYFYRKRNVVNYFAAGVREA